MSDPLRLARTRRAAIVLAVAGAFAAAPVAAQASAVNLATAAPFVVLAGSTATNTGPSVLNGDLGVSPGTALVGFGSPAVISGATHANDAVAAQAQNDLTTAYDVAAGQPVTANLTGQDLGGKTLTAGAYFFSSSAQLTGSLTLDAQGDPAAQFVFEIGSTLTTASASSVRLINGASPCNVYWKIGSSATLGTATDFAGTLMALTSITLDNSARVTGRALARNGAVTLDDNVLDAAACNAPAGSGGSGTGTGAGTATGTGTNPGAGSGTATGTPQTRDGTALMRHTHPSAPGRCVSGFRATVRGRMIWSVTFWIGGRHIASPAGSPLSVSVSRAAARQGSLLAYVMFKDATHAVKLRYRYRACSAAVLRPARGPSRFTG